MTELLDIEVPLDRDALAHSFERRIGVIQDCDGNEGAQAVQRALCAADPVHFFCNFCVTYDPRLITYDLPAYVPFDLFPRQEELVRWLDARVAAAEEGLLEKSRDVGWTWVAAGYALNKWLFVPGFRTTFGSRKVDLVDKLGDPDSILEKVRILIDRLPQWLLPKGWRREAHANHCKITNPENGNVIGGEGGAEMGRGGRAAQPLDAAIITPSGIVRMGDIQVGSVVIGSDGKPTNVIGVYPQGKKEIFKVTFDDGSSTECCDDHLWQVTTPSIRKSLRDHHKWPWTPRHLVLHLSEIRHNLFVDRSDNNKELRFQIPVVQPVEFDEVDLPLDPYVVGALLGDGDVSNVQHTSVGFSTAEDEMLSLVAQRIPIGCEITGGEHLSYRLIDKDRVYGLHNPIKAAIKQLGLAGHESHDKFIPDLYKFASPLDRLEVIRGLMDTDGWVIERNNSSKVCYSTTSPQLAEDMRFMVMSLGGTANQISITGKPGKFPGGCEYDRRDGYQLTLNMPVGMCPFRLTRKTEKYKERTKYKVRRSIMSVECIGEKEVQCIAVDAPDQLYVTDDFIVTHNTLYLVDEGAYIDHADSVAAAILANADCRVWASSVNGPGDLFARKRHDGTLRPDQIFTFHYSDDPRKTEEWARRKRRELSATPWMFAKEYDIDYTAAVEGICIPAAWVKAALRLGELIPFSRSEAACVAGLDIGDTCARSVLQPRFGPLLVPPESWDTPDTTNTAFAALEAAKRIGVTTINYDSIGVGKGVQSTLTLNPVEGVAVRPINAGWPPTWRTTWPDGESSRMKFANLKAELWWLARERFRCAAEHHAWLTGDEVLGIEPREHDVSDMFLFEPAPAHAYRETIVQLSQPVRKFNTKGKIILESKQDLAKRGVVSPDFAEGLVLSLVPSDVDGSVAVAPIVATGQRGYPELNDGSTRATVTVRVSSGGSAAGGVAPAVPTGKRFDSDFAREW